MPDPFPKGPGPYPVCKGPPFNSDWETVSGGGLSFLTKDFATKAAVWRCRELEEEVACKGAEIIRLHNREIARFRTLRRDVDQIKRALQRHGGERG